MLSRSMDLHKNHVIRCTKKKPEKVLDFDLIRCNPRLLQHSNQAHMEEVGLQKKIKQILAVNDMTRFRWYLSHVIGNNNMSRPIDFSCCHAKIIIYRQKDRAHHDGTRTDRAEGEKHMSTPLSNTLSKCNTLDKRIRLYTWTKKKYSSEALQVKQMWGPIRQKSHVLCDGATININTDTFSTMCNKLDGDSLHVNDKTKPKHIFGVIEWQDHQNRMNRSTVTLSLTPNKIKRKKHREKWKKPIRT